MSERVWLESTLTLNTWITVFVLQGSTEVVFCEHPKRTSYPAKLVLSFMNKCFMSDPLAISYCQTNWLVVGDVNLYPTRRFYDVESFNERIAPYPVSAWD